jgi:hypothetical protein
MQRTGREQMKLYLDEKGPAAAGGFARGFEPYANEWLAGNGHDPVFVFKSAAPPHGRDCRYPLTPHRAITTRCGVICADQ